MRKPVTWRDDRALRRKQLNRPIVANGDSAAAVAVWMSEVFDCYGVSEKSADAWKHLAWELLIETFPKAKIVQAKPKSRAGRRFAPRRTLYRKFSKFLKDKKASNPRISAKKVAELFARKSENRAECGKLKNLGSLVNGARDFEKLLAARRGRPQYLRAAYRFALGLDPIPGITIKRP